MSSTSPLVQLPNLRLTTSPPASPCLLFNSKGEVLITRRALSKKAWPGVWTNSFCGHPAPDESFEDALARHAAHELGARVVGIKSLLPDFKYRATDPLGVVENEFCPVFSAVIKGDITPNSDEVMQWEWVKPADIARSLSATPWAFSPWFVWQARQLEIYQIEEPHEPAS